MVGALRNSHPSGWTKGRNTKDVEHLDFHSLLAGLGKG